MFVAGLAAIVMSNTIMRRSSPLSAVLMVVARLANASAFLSPDLQYKYGTSLQFNKVPKVADASAEWPNGLPSWVSRTDWTRPSIEEATGIIYLDQDEDHWSVEISNLLPTWEPIYACVVGTSPPGAAAAVYPAFATLAPCGGCDNLCNVNERYTDTIVFVVPRTGSLNSGSLWVRTEEQCWCFRLELTAPQLP